MTGIMIAPHTPPQKASEMTAGTPKGGTGRMAYGAKGDSPIRCSKASVSW